MLREEEKELRTAMHDAREHSGITQYVPAKRDIKPILEDLIDSRDDAVYGIRCMDKERFNLDESYGVASYSDIRDWVEDVVDGFHKGMQFDGLVDKKKNVRRAVSLFLKPTKGYMVYLNNNSRHDVKAFKPHCATR